MEFMGTVKYDTVDYKREKDMLKELEIEAVLNKILKYKTS